MTAYDGNEIIQRFIELPNESPLSREGAFSLFHQSFIDRDNAVLLSNGTEFHVFYFTSYDIVEEVGDENPVVIMEPVGNMVRCVIIFNPEGNQVTMMVALDLKDAQHREFFRFLKEKGAMEFHFISMLYGELHKMKSLTIKVPDAAFESISEKLS